MSVRVTYGAHESMRYEFFDRWSDALDWVYRSLVACADYYGGPVRICSTQDCPEPLAFEIYESDNDTLLNRYALEWFCHA